MKVEIDLSRRQENQVRKMTPGEPMEKDTVRTSISYIIPWWDRSVPGKRGPFAGRFAARDRQVG